MFSRTSLAAMLLLGVALIVAPPTTSSAASIALQIDTSQSTIALAATFRNVAGLTLPLEEQAPGSLVAAFTGDVAVDIVGSQLSLHAEADAITLPGTYVPHTQLGNPMDPEPADLAGEVINPDVSRQLFYAVRDLTLELGNLPKALDAQGQFDASGIFVNAGFNAATFVGDPVGSASIYFDDGPESLLNNPAVSGTFERVGSQYVLTIPFSTTWRIFSLDANLQQISGSLTGQIVATAIVPEPSSAVLLTLGGLMITAWRRRRSRSWRPHRS